MDDSGSSKASASAKRKGKTSDKKSSVPSDQFGRNVHAMVRFANKVAEELADDKSE
jgi:hypothetical protein